MGTFFHPLRLIGPNGQTLDFEALVDTGATFTSVPASALEELGVQPVRRVRLRLANGQSHEQVVGEARAEINDDQVTTLVVFGEPGSPPAIGAYTLEGLMLGVDPVGQELVALEGWRATHA